MIRQVNEVSAVMADLEEEYLQKKEENRRKKVEESAKSKERRKRNEVKEREVERTDSLTCGDFME